MITNANALHIPLAPRSVHMVATSPPYWGLRSYATATWVGGDSDCDHAKDRSVGVQSSTLGGGKKTTNHQQETSYRDVCAKCGAHRLDAQLGAEKLHDCLAWARGEEPCGACYVCAMRAVARELWRVLRDDGVWWLNLGDSYLGGKGASSQAWSSSHKDRATLQKDHHHVAGMGSTRPTDLRIDGLKPKDLAGIPWRVALALQADGWYLRSDVIWAKPNPMPESVTDRCTKAHEYVFMLAKSARYYYDCEAVKEGSVDDEYTSRGKVRKTVDRLTEEDATIGRYRANLHKQEGGRPTRNRRTVWTIATQPYAGAHYAVWPPALVEPMILAGTSARGVCSACGAQWVRVVETGELMPSGSRTDVIQASGSGESSCQKPGHAVSMFKRERTTTGWRASCDCNAGEPVPAIVLDPFCGSGTTGAVARLHGRRFVGLDLSMDYLRGQALARAEGLTTPESLAELPMFSETLTQR